MKFLKILFAIFIAVAMVVYSAGFTYADELDDINKQLEELNNALKSSQQATETNEKELASLNTRLEGIKAHVAQIEAAIAEKEAEIAEGEKELAGQKDMLDDRVISFYKNKGKERDLLLQLLMTDNLGNFLKQFTYQQTILDDNKRAILRTAFLVDNIEEKKKELESERARLEPIKEEIAAQSEFLAGEVASAKQYQTELSGKIGELSARQQEIMAARSGSFTFSIGSGELADEYLSSIKGFRESAPGGYFAIFSIGAYTHRKGMSQYGARGRAQSGQNYKDILRAYYQKEPVSKDTGGAIRVSGYGEMDFETSYLYGIAEMPSSWHGEALKAQAIAARTYAYRYKQEGREICTTESCQVFRKDKSDNPPAEWKNAVDSTKGEVLEDVITYYASTHGVYITTPGWWDTSDGGGGSNFIDKSYEKAGNSPWVYKSWWRQGYSNSGDTCGRSNPWLSPEEMADIINAAIALKTGGIDTGRITPVTTSCWGGNPYSMSELRDLVSGKGGISSATSVSVSQGNGNTNSVTINGVTLSGSEFKRAVCLRAPGYIRIPQSSCEGGWAFFNVEKK